MPYLSRKLRGEIAAEETAAELRLDVAHQLQRKARVVLDDAVDLFDRLALRPQLDGAQLQPSMKMSVEEYDDEPTAAPPMSIQCTLMAKKPMRSALAGPGVDRRVHHRVVEMLALDAA